MEPSLLPYRLPHIKNKKIIASHVVIVGAGAFLAVCKYDKHGREVSLLENIHRILELDSKLKTYGFQLKKWKILNFFTPIYMRRKLQRFSSVFE